MVPSNLVIVNNNNGLIISSWFNVNQRYAEFLYFCSLFTQSKKIVILLLLSWLQVLRRRSTSRKTHKNILIQPITEDAQRIVSTVI